MLKKNIMHTRKDKSFIDFLERILLIKEDLTSSSAVALRMAKEKFAELCSNDEYLFDCDKNTKDEVNLINKLLNKINSRKYEIK